MKTATPSHVAAEPGGLLAALRAWDRFWFKPSDPTTLGFIRICAGAVTLYVHLAYTIGLLNYVGPHAWIDTPALNWLRYEVSMRAPALGWSDQPETIAHGHRIWSVYYSVTDPFWIYATHAFFLAAMLLFTVGLWTRVTSVLTWVGAMCYLQRAPTTLFGMDTMMNILLIYLMIGPSGAALSVDRWLRLRRQGLTPGTAPPPEPRASATFATRCLQIHFCFIYLASGLSKLLGASWWSGTAVWGTVANYSFAPMDLPWYSELLYQISRQRWLWETVMTTGVVFTLFLEISLPYLVWLPRWRWWMIGGAILLHTGIGLTMGLVTFGLFMITMVFSFVPPEAVHYLLRQGREFFAALVGRAAPPAAPAARQPAQARG